MPLIEHELSKLFGDMPDNEYQALKADIQANGQHHAIMVLCDDAGHGTVLDGRHRLRACQELRLVPKCQEWAGECGTPEKFIISMNWHRRNLDESQRGIVAAGLAKRGIDVTRKFAGDQATDESGQKLGITFSEAAEFMKVSERTVSDAAVVLEKGTEEEIERVKQGKDKVSRVARDIRAGKTPTQRAAERKEKRKPRSPKAKANGAGGEPKQAQTEPEPQPEQAAPKARTPCADPAAYVPAKVKQIVLDILHVPVDPELVMMMVRDTAEIGDFVQQNVYHAQDWLDRYCAALTQARNEAIAAKNRRG